MRFTIKILITILIGTILSSSCFATAVCRTSSNRHTSRVEHSSEARARVLAYEECKEAIGTNNGECWHNMKCATNSEGISGEYYNCYVNLPGHLLEADGRTEAEAHFFLTQKCSKRKGLTGYEIRICMTQRTCNQEYR